MKKRQRKSGSKDYKLEKLVLATATIELIKTMIELIKDLME